MRVTHVEFMVEEPSLEVFLEGLLPRLLEAVAFKIHPFQGKRHLLKHLPSRLRGYGHWLPEDWRIVVVVDRDADDCHKLKAQLEQYARDAALFTRSRRSGEHFTVVNRIAVEELEAWYFGDWQAVRAAYPRVSAKVPRKSPYRDPDAIGGGTWETFERILQRAGYFRTGLRKMEAAAAIVPNLEPTRNTSRSFQVFRDAVLEFAQT